MNYFWKIDDGRVWSFAAARFVLEDSIADAADEAEARAVVIPLYNDGVLGDVNYLREVIIFNKGDLGELRSVAETVALYDEAIDARLEDFARQLYSKGLVGAIGYTVSSNPVWRMEAEFLARLRDTVHMTNQETLNELLPQVAAGEIPVPAFAEITARLPELKWPAGSRGHALPALPWAA